MDKKLYLLQRVDYGNGYDSFAESINLAVYLNEQLAERDRESSYQGNGPYRNYKRCNFVIEEIDFIEE